MRTIPCTACAPLPEIAAPEATYTGCVTLGSPTILHCFPAHVTDLQQVHRDELDRIAILIRNGDLTGKRIRRIRIVGHAASWRGLSRADYVSRALTRAGAARRYLRDRLSRMGLSYRPVITVAGKADDAPLVPNMVQSTSRTARRNREINRRVEIFLNRARPRRRPRRPDRPLPTDWEAFLNTKLRQLGTHWEVQRPFDTNRLHQCIRRKLLRRGVKDDVMEPMGKVGALPKGDPVSWTGLRDDLIADLKSGMARGPIRNFERRFDLHVDNLWTAVRQLGYRISGLDIYNRALTAEWRRAKRASGRRSHLYSCKVIRDHIKRVED